MMAGCSSTAFGARGRSHFSVVFLWRALAAADAQHVRRTNRFIGFGYFFLAVAIFPLCIWVLIFGKSTFKFSFFSIDQDS
jgi:hypothetical protein